MKKTITKLALILGIGCFLNTSAQTTVTFDTFTLSANSYYQDNAGTDWTVGASVFQYDWNAGWSMWSGGSAYTNVNDTVDGTYTNLYGAITAVAYSGNNYVTLQNNAMIAFTNSTTAIQGFYVTNTTYAYKTIKNGDSFSRKFGDTTGTGSGTSIPQGEYPDWFKLSVVGFRGGVALTDSVHFYLADYRPAGKINDYAIKNWQYVNCTSLGTVDSIKFVLNSSDVGQWGMNTPAFFSIDNFTTLSTVGMEELTSVSNFVLYPNPTSGNTFVTYNTSIDADMNLRLFDINGREILNATYNSVVGQNQIKLATEGFESGVYFIELNNGTSSKKIKFIKL